MRARGSSTGTRPRRGLGGPQRVVGVTEGDQPSRFEQGQLGFHERPVKAGGGTGFGVTEGFDQIVDVVPATGMVRSPGGGEGQTWVSSEHVSGEELRPFPQRFLPALPDQDPSLAVDELGAAVGFAGGDVVADGVAGHVMVGEPVGGAAVAGARIIAALQAEPVGEQMVVAEPLAAMVERDDEQVQPIELVEPVLGVVDAGDGLAERGVEPIEDGGGDQELVEAIGKPGQDLVSQVVRDVAVVAGELADELGLGPGGCAMTGRRAAPRPPILRCVRSAGQRRTGRARCPSGR